MLSAALSVKFCCLSVDYILHALNYTKNKLEGARLVIAKQREAATYSDDDNSPPSPAVIPLVLRIYGAWNEERVIN